MEYKHPDGGLKIYREALHGNFKLRLGVYTPYTNVLLMRTKIVTDP